MRRLDLRFKQVKGEIGKHWRLISVKADIEQAVSRKNDAHPEKKCDLTGQAENVIIDPVEYQTFGAGCKSLPVV
jgi:hypothetical protein